MSYIITMMTTIKNAIGNIVDFMYPWKDVTIVLHTMKFKGKVHKNTQKAVIVWGETIEIPINLNQNAYTVIER